MSLLGGTYGSRELEINSNDAKRGDGCLQADSHYGLPTNSRVIATGSDRSGLS